ncbi:nuclear transport factor 2 family protein [Pleurocapsales cyanobacterium LEGE 06147]|nr:nuclear transport factor 2 family protein [Pleurocapsales cyanobacterium LEGE 06147]
MNRKQAIAEIVTRQARAWENADAAAIVADFAADATFIVPGSIFEGKQAIRAAAQNHFGQFTEIKIKIKRIIAGDNQGAVEWDWTDKNKKTGKQSYAEDAIIFALRDGKITYWREYIEEQSQQSN